MASDTSPSRVGPDTTQTEEELRRLITMDDLVAAIVARSALQEFSASPRIVHSAFFELTRKDVVPQLEELNFSQTGKFPFSHLLERVLFRLEMCGFLTLRNPDYDVYVVGSEPRQIFLEKIRRVFSHELTSQVDKLSEAFAKKIIAEL